MSASRPLLARPLRIASVELGALHGTVVGAANARATWRTRTGLLLRLRDTDGRIGIGEASPLPGYSPDDLRACRAALQALPRPADWRPLRSLDDIRSTCDTIGPPAARFALESALIDLLGQALQLPAATLLAAECARSPHDRASLCALIGDPLAGERAQAQVERALDRGVSTVKVKIGRPDAFADELHWLAAVRERYGDALSIRLDVNRSWTLSQAASRLPELAALAPEYVEEPCPEMWHLPAVPVPLAADESLIGASPERVEALLSQPSLAALVLKPMVLGGLLPCLALADRARAHGLQAVPSHLMDGPVALAAYAQLALLTGGTCGLDHHPGLAAWPAVALSSLAQDHIVARSQPGLGIDADACEALWSARVSPLSLAHMSRERPSAPYLIFRDRVLSYRDMQALAGAQEDQWPARSDDDHVPGLPLLVADRGPETVARLLFALERERPLALLPVRSSEPMRADAARLCRSSEPDADLAFALFTSGSQGRPKAVQLTRTAFLASAHANADHLGWRDDDRWLCCLPLAHIGGLSIAVRCLTAGACMVLTPEGPFDAEAIIATIARHRVTLMSLVPTMLVRLLDHGWTPPGHVRAVLVGGAATSPSLLQRARQRGVPALVTYGMTETCSQIATQTPGEHDLDQTRAPGHIGPLLAGVEVAFDDGRLLVRGPMRMRGYLGEVALPDDAYHETGDRGYLDDRGHLHVLGRLDEVIITGGENVAPAVVEAALCRHPAIAAACVFGVEDPAWGQVVAAAVVLAEPTATAIEPNHLADLLAGFLAERLPAHERPRLWCRLPVLLGDGQLKMRRREVAERARPHLRPLRYPRADNVS